MIWLGQVRIVVLEVADVSVQDDSENIPKGEMSRIPLKRYTDDV